MRITKLMLREIRSKLIESQARLCALAVSGEEALTQEFIARYPHYVGSPPSNPMETLRQLLYDDLLRAIPSYICE